LTNSIKLVEGLGEFEIENAVLFPSIVPKGTSLSMNPAVPDDVPGVALLTILFTVALRLDTEVPKPASVVLKPLKLEVTVLRDVDRAFR
jgi:hypothetical protein